MRNLLGIFGLVLGCTGISILIHSSVGGRSHIKGMLEVGQELAERGHSVRYVAIDDNLRFAKGHNITRVGLGHKGLFTDTVVQFLDSSCGETIGEDFQACFGKVVVKWLSESYRHEYVPLREHVEQDRPDLMLCDLFANACNEVAEMNGIPLVMGIQALDWLNIFNMPYMTKETRFGPLTIEGMSFGDKMFDTLVVDYAVGKFWAGISAAMNHERQLVGSKADWVPKGAFHYGIGLANSFFGFEVPQHLPPNIRTVGPILSTSFQPLDQPLLDFLDTHKEVMLIGFGSLLSIQKPAVAKIILGAQEAMDQGHIDGVIWGLGRTLAPNTTDDRFRILKWAPQQSILNHPNTVVFLSHGGLESSVEAIHSRTANIIFPFLADQALNGAKLQELGVGLHMNPKRFDLAASIKTILNHPNLEMNLAKAYALTQSHLKRRQEAANYIEDHFQVAQACRPYQPYIPGGNQPPCELSHLLPASTRLSYIQANRFDVYLVAASILLGAFATMILLIHKVTLALTSTKTVHTKSE